MELQLKPTIAIGSVNVALSFALSLGRWPDVIAGYRTLSGLVAVMAALMGTAFGLRRPFSQTLLLALVAFVVAGVWYGRLLSRGGLADWEVVLALCLYAGLFFFGSSLLASGTKELMRLIQAVK